MKNRSLEMKRLVIIFFTVIILANGTAWSAEFFDATLGDFKDDLQTAKEQGKKGIMLFFEEDT